MKIQVASDLHLEHLAHRFPRETLIRPAYQADVLVLAGDIGHAADAIALFADWPVPVLYVMGNHEAYNGCIESVQDKLKFASYATSVKFLELEAVDFGGVRFLGCTLWTDYRLQAGGTHPQIFMDNASRCLNDHHLIHTMSGEPFSPKHALRIHETSKAWLASELARDYDGTTVVITHHAPHSLSVHPRYEGDPLNAAFASDLTELMREADIWIHGHVHDSFDYQVSGCRVVANPRGYARNVSSAGSAQSLRFENNEFQYACIIDTIVRGPVPLRTYPKGASL